MMVIYTELRKTLKKENKNEGNENGIVGIFVNGICTLAFIKLYAQKQ